MATRANSRASQRSPRSRPSESRWATALLNSRAAPTAHVARPFALPRVFPPVVGEAGKTALAMDEASPGNVLAASSWAGGYYNWAFSEGLEFLGYPYLAELAQRAEYRRIVEITATEMTRKWIRIKYKSGDGNPERLQAINDEMDRLSAREYFRKIASQDGFFGRAHLYMDTGATDQPDELKTPIGDGLESLSEKKVNPDRPLRRLGTVEAVWCYPTNYNSSDPLRADWYRPDMWFSMGKQVHVSRLLCFIGREVPDLLKPAYSFGGLSLTQMAKPYVDNWLQTRQSVNDIVSAYSQMVLATDVSEQLQAGGEELYKRLDVFNNLRNNRGVMAIDKENEEFSNVAAPLAGLHELQAQAQEHMASVSGIPLVKLLGIQPGGLNASSEGEIRTWYDWVLAQQELLFRPNLAVVLRFVQLSLFGKVDEDVVFEFLPLWALDEVQQADLDNKRADTATKYIDSGVLDAHEERERLAAQPDSIYGDIDPDDDPDLGEEEANGLEPQGGRPQMAEAEQTEEREQLDGSTRD